MELDEPADLRMDDMDFNIDFNMHAVDNGIGRATPPLKTNHNTEMTPKAIKRVCLDFHFSSKLLICNFYCCFSPFLTLKKVCPRLGFYKNG
jgi:hypothetical protein